MRKLWSRFSAVFGSITGGHRGMRFPWRSGYEDFIQGWRPNESGGFILHDGHFKRFCERAENDQTRPYVFIIDEINRGNLNRIFGELMVLLEVDKRGQGMALTYSPDDEFMIPPNVHVLGLMNTADRSLAVVDYALRRRFAFASLLPCFDSPKFAEVLEANNVSRQCARKIKVAMSELNPIRNLYHLLLYALEIGPIGGSQRVSMERAPNGFLRGSSCPMHRVSVSAAIFLVAQRL